MICMKQGTDPGMDPFASPPPEERKEEPAVSRVLSWTTIHLGQPSPTASSNLPGSPLRRAVQAKACALPYLVLLQAGFTLPRRVATRAVRSYRTFSPLPARLVIDKWRLGGMFSVALSMDSCPPGVTWRPARWSPDFPPPPYIMTAAVVWPTLAFSNPSLYRCIKTRVGRWFAGMQRQMKRSHASARQGENGLASAVYSPVCAFRAPHCETVFNAGSRGMRFFQQAASRRGLLLRVHLASPTWRSSEQP